MNIESKHMEKSKLCENFKKPNRYLEGPTTSKIPIHKKTYESNVHKKGVTPIMWGIDAPTSVFINRDGGSKNCS